MKRYITLILLSLLSISSMHAKSYEGEVSNFSELEGMISIEKDFKHTLIVMDDDDTLTMMKCDKSMGTKNCQYLGGPAWFAWQDKLTKKNSSSLYKIAQKQDELFNISSLLFSLNNMVYTDKNIPNVLSRLSKKGVKLLVETARGNSDLSATTDQFTNLKTKDGTFIELIENNSLKFGEYNIASLASPFKLLKDSKTPITYQRGVMYLSGQDKGEMLKAILSKYNSKKSKIKNIFFIDDTPKNVRSVYKAFKNDPKYTVHALHYTALDEHKAALKKEVIYQKQSYDRWITIKKMMEATLLDPNLN